MSKKGPNIFDDSSSEYSEAPQKKAKKKNVKPDRNATKTVTIRQSTNKEKVEMRKRIQPSQHKWFYRNPKLQDELQQKIKQESITQPVDNQETALASNVKKNEHQNNPHVKQVQSLTPNEATPLLMPQDIIDCLIAENKQLEQELSLARIEALHWKAEFEKLFNQRMGIQEGGVSLPTSYLPIYSHSQTFFAFQPLISPNVSPVKFPISSRLGDENSTSPSKEKSERNVANRRLDF